jgi:hypothetical protein
MHGFLLKNIYLQNKEREHLLSKTIEIETLKTHVNNLKHFSNIAKESQSKINDLNEELIRYIEAVACNKLIVILSKMFFSLNIL